MVLTDLRTFHFLILVSYFEKTTCLSWLALNLEHSSSFKLKCWSLLATIRSGKDGDMWKGRSQQTFFSVSTNLCQMDFEWILWMTHFWQPNKVMQRQSRKKKIKFNLFSGSSVFSVFENKLVFVLYLLYLLNLLKSCVICSNRGVRKSLGSQHFLWLRRDFDWPLTLYWWFDLGSRWN